MKPLWDRFMEMEESAVGAFLKNGFWKWFRELPDEQFLWWVIQMHHISMHFVPWYEGAKFCLRNQAVVTVIRKIIWDEVPLGKPTHQDNRLYDLSLMGIPPDRVVASEPAPSTLDALRSLDLLIRYMPDDYDLRVAVSLRIAGETLVADQCRMVAEGMRDRFKIPFNASRFYVPHWLHDERSGDHGLLWEQAIRPLVKDERTLQVAHSAVNAALLARIKFFGPEYFMADTSQL